MANWKDIQGYDGLYEVSDDGRVRSLNYHRMGITKELKPGITEGYKHVILCKNKLHKRCLVHRLVAEAFIPNPNNYPVVNHKDENPSNNKASNLEWCSAYYNNNYGTAHKRAGEHKSKVINQYSKDDELITTFYSIKEAEEITGIPKSNICACLKGKRKTAGGYHWLYT